MFDPNDKGLPKNYTPHDGGACPVDPAELVVTVVRTSEGLGLSEPAKASNHEWLASEHPDGIGAIIGYRIAQRGEHLTREALERRWPEE